MIYLKSYKKPEYNINEILRYMSCKQKDAALEAVLEECIGEIGERLSFKVCCCEITVKKDGEMLDLGFMKTKSEGLKKNLDGCEKGVLFAATVGLEMDRLIARYGTVSPVKSVVFQAIGAERIESLCDMFEADVKECAASHGGFTRPRFSAGYGDFELSAQRAIFDALDCRRKIGITLNDSLLMSPTKSVTAIIGISDREKNCEKGCSVCNNTQCEYRKGGAR